MTIRVWGFGFVASGLALALPLMAEPVVRPLPAAPVTPRVVSASPSVAVSKSLPTPDKAYAAVCAAQWKDAKAARTLAQGDTYPLFMARCQTHQGKLEGTVARVRTLKTPSTEARDVHVQAKQTLEPVPKTKRPPTAKQKALYARMRQCGVLWRKAKAAGTIPAGQEWPQYWSHCNTKLKAKR